MAKIATVKQTEQWLKEVNGGYDILFKAMTVVAADNKPGTLLIVGGEPVGIVAQALTDTTARVMVRGNPSMVMLDVNPSDANIAKLSAKGIVVIAK